MLSNESQPWSTKSKDALSDLINIDVIIKDPEERDPVIIG